MLYQLSYAPGSVAIVPGGFPQLGGGHTGGMGHVMDPNERDDSGPPEDELMAEQEEKGYGEDEGEREEALPEE